MTDREFEQALDLLNHAVALLQQRETVQPAEFTGKLNHLLGEFDALRVQIGQSPPQQQRN